MQLPELKHPTYFLTLPSNGKQVKFRPFLVKEEKILLLAATEQDPKTSIQAIKDVINNCTYGVLDVEKLPIFDIEWIFLQLRIKSKGDSLKLQYICNNIPEGSDKPCNTEIGITIDLNSLEVIKPENHSKKIELDDNVGIIMKYPTIDLAEELDSFADNPENVEHIIAKLIDSVYEGDIVREASEYKHEDLVAWIQTFNEEQANKLEQFFDTYPKVSKTIKIKCPKCGHEEEITLEGLQNFLA